MRKYIIGLAIIVIAGVAVSLTLIPGDEDLVRMQERDEKLVNAGLGFGKQYSMGVRTAFVVGGRADELIAEGNTLEAIAILEDYVTSNPNDPEGHLKLANVYQYAEEDEKYLSELEWLAANAPDANNLKLLADHYNYLREYEKQAATLKKLIQVSQGTQPEHYVALATIQTQIGDRKGAIETLESLQAQHPDHVSYDYTKLLVTNLMQEAEGEQAFEYAQNWLNSSAVPQQVAELTNNINFLGRPDLAVQLIVPHRQLITKDVDVLLAYINAHIAAHRSGEAYKLMVTIHEQGKLPTPLYRPFLQQALEKGDTGIALDVARKMNPEWFTEDDAINLLELARLQKAHELGDVLIEQFDQPAYVQDKPVLQAVIALLKDDPQADTAIAAALKVELSKIQHTRLAQACAREKKEKCFDVLVAKYPSLSEMNAMEVAEFVNLYITTGRQEEIYDAIDAAYQERPILVTSWLWVSAASGKRAEVMEWVKDNPENASAPVLSQLYFMAYDNGHNMLATDLAELSYAQKDTPANRERLINAYMETKQYAKALPLLRQDVGNSQAHEDNYLIALSKLARNNSKYRTELTRHITTRLDSDELTQQRELEYLFMLINGGNRSAALPYIRKYASRGGEWKRLYDQTHNVASARTAASAPVKLSREAMLKLAFSQEVADQRRRELAFELLNDGHRADTIEIFKLLAAKNGAFSRDVQELLFLWGPRLNAEQIVWLDQRARNSVGAESAKWIEYISSYTDDFTLMQFVTSNPGSLRYPALRRKYFTALATHGKPGDFDQGMQQWVNATNSVDALSDYAEIAQAFGFKQAAVVTNRKINSLAPGHEKTLHDLGVLTFSQSDYSGAENYLNQYLNVHQQSPRPQTNPYMAHFYKAQLAKRAGQTEASHYHFQQAYENASRLMNPDVEAQSILYTSQFHLGAHTEASTGFRRLLQLYPNNKTLLADFMSVLIEYKYYDEAKAVANQYDPNARGQRMGTVGVNSPYVQGFSRHSNGRELEITFSEPVGDTDPLQLGNDERFDWVENTQVTHDKVLVTAKPGYTVRYQPVSANGARIVPAQRMLSPQEEMARQQDLRLQLLYARIELETGKEHQALARLHAIEPHFEDDAQYLGYLANAENYSGNWNKALRLLDKASTITPENEDIARLYDDIKKVHGQQVMIDHEWRRIGNSDEQITTAAGKVFVNEKVEVGAVVQNNFVEGSEIRNESTGVITDTEDNVQRGEFFVAYNLEDGSRARGALFTNNDTVGAGAYYAFSNQLGRTELLGEYHKPYWDFVDAVVKEANRDRVGFKHTAQINPKTTFASEVSLNNYNIADADDVATSVLVRGSVIRMLQEADPYIAVGYGFDGEYLDKKQRAVGINGNFYAPFELTSREIHFFSAIFQHDFSDTTSGQLVAGYAFNRLGEHGPQIEGRLTQQLTNDLEAQARFRYGLESNNTNNNVTQLGGHLLYRF